MKKSYHVSLKHLARYLVIAGVVLATTLAITACEEAAAGAEDDAASGGTVTPVDPVTTVTLDEQASTADFDSFTPQSGATLVNDKTDVLYLLGIAAVTVTENVGDYLDLMDLNGTPWEPSNDGSSLSVTPEDLFERNDPPTSISITGVLVNEALDDMLTINADGTVSVQMSLNPDDLPTSITGTADGEVHTPLIGTMTDPYYSSSKVHGGSVHGALAANASVGFQWRQVSDPDYPQDTWYEPSSVNANLAMSGRVSVAVSVEGDIGEYTTRLVYGHMLLTVGWDPQVSVNITQAMLDDETGDALTTYLETIEVADPTVTVAVYDHGASTPASEFNYTIADLTAMFEGGGEEEVLSSLLSRMSR